MVESEPETQSLVAAQLGALADALADQPASVGEQPSLCAGWSVRNVLAHMTTAARHEPAEFVALLARFDGNFTRLSDHLADLDGALPLEQLLEDLRSQTMAHWAPPQGGAAGALSHAVIHGLDITEAVGIPPTCSDRALRGVLDILTRGGVAANFGVDPESRHLIATDIDWEYGRGEVRSAPAATLITDLAGRTR